MNRPKKDIYFKDDLRNKLLKGVKTVYDVVAPTMGAKGRNVLFWQGIMARSTKDGVTAAIEVFMKDKMEDLGAFLAKEACMRTNKESGDGTTATCVLLYSILAEASKLVTAGANPIQLKKGITLASECVLKALDAIAKPISSKAEVKNVANIAINGDEEISMLIAEAIETAGKDGVVTCRESNYNKSYLETNEGMQINQGYFTPAFANPMTMECVLENPYIICYEGAVRNVPECTPLVTKIGEKQRPLLFICHECNLDVIRWLIHNTQKGIIQACVIRTPGTAKVRDEIIRDFAVYTGGKALGEYAGELPKAHLNELGSCERVVLKRNTTTFYKGKGTDADINERVATIRRELEEIEDKNLKEIYLQRIARLTSSICVIHIGGQTELELQERKDRVEDALQAVKAAQSEGIVAGGGIAFLEAREDIDTVITSTDGDVRLGAEIMFRSLRSPFDTIISNAGLNSVVVENNINTNLDTGIDGFDVNKEGYCNMVEAGIIDPVLVLKTAIKNAVSISMQMLTAQAGIVMAEDIKDAR